MNEYAVSNAEDDAAESAAATSGNAGRFQRGNPGYRLRRAAEEKEKGAPVPQQLRDMRWVYSKPEEKDRTQGQRTCRQWLKDDPKGFMTHKSQLEAKLLALAPCRTEGGSGESNGTPALTDKGTERGLDLIDGFLDDWKTKQAEEDAKLAARPDAAQIAATLQHSLTASLEREAMWKNQVHALREQVKELGGNAG